MGKRGTTRNWLILAAGPDESHALWLQQVLRAGNRRADIALWRADLDVTDMRSLARDVENLLERALGVIGLLTQRSLGDDMPRAVWLTAIRDYLLGERPFLGIRMESGDPGPLLGQLPFIDLKATQQQQQVAVNALYQRLYGLEQFPTQLGSGRPDLSHLPGLAQSERAAALVHTARQLKDIDNIDSAVECLLAALAIRERILSPADPLLSATLLTAAEVTLEAGKVETARTHLLQAYDRLRQSPWGSRTLIQQWTQIERLSELAVEAGDSRLHADIVALQREMLPRMEGGDFDKGLIHARSGRLARESGDAQTAINEFLAALEVWRESPPEVPAEYARLLNDLGTLSIEQGEWQTAEAFLTEALARWKAIRGEESAEVATTLANLGALFRQLGNPARAKGNLLAALELRMHLTDPLDPLIGQTLHQLAAIEADEGRLTDAEAHYRQALAILEASERSLAEASAVRNNLALLLDRLGRHAEAAELLETSWQLACSTLGDQHPACLPILENTAAHYERTGQLDKAIARRQSAIALLADDPAQADRLTRQWRQIALLEIRQGHTETAQFAIAEAERYAAQLPEGHPEREALRPLQVQLTGNTGDIRARLKLLDVTLNDLLHRLDSLDPQLIPPLEELATLQMQLGDYDDAATYLERVLMIREKTHGRTSPELLPTILQLGRVYKAKGSKGRLGSIAKRAQQLLAKLPSPTPDLQQAVADLTA